MGLLQTSFTHVSHAEITQPAKLWTHLLELQKLEYPKSPSMGLWKLNEWNKCILLRAQWQRLH